MVENINYNKYYVDGWGLSIFALQSIHSLILENKLSRVLEFGSGKSTSFLEDLGINYTSFDDDKHYKADYSSVLLRPLKQTSLEFYDKITSGEKFNNKEYQTFSHPKEKSTRQERCFYDIQDGDLNGKYDLVILDGPNGNGRSIAFSIIKKYISNPCYIFIDDYNHYPFITHLKNNFPKVELILSHNQNESDCFEIYKIK